MNLSDYIPSFDFLGGSGSSPIVPNTFNSGGGYVPSLDNLNFNGTSNPTSNLSSQGFSSSIPNVGGGGTGLGLQDFGGIGGIANILAGLGQTWNGFQQQKNARKALNFQKDAFNRTFANNNKVYNQNMEDVLRARSSQTGQNYDKIIAERRL